jgi:hypothetical protein
VVNLRRPVTLNAKSGLSHKGERNHAKESFNRWRG